MVAAKLATFDQGRPLKKAPIGGLKLNEAAQSLKVGKRSVQRAKKVLDSGTPEVQKAVERGDLSVRPAAARQRLHRQRVSEGRWVVQIEIWTELADALEIAGFGPVGGIWTRQDAAEAITAALRRWESGLDRLRPASDVTRDRGNDEPVVSISNRKIDDDDANDD